jgi:hypothetical protein
MGDLDAKVGGDNDSYEKVMGRHDCGNMNENDEYFIEFCGNNSMFIGGTLFQDKIRKLTWVSS